MYCTVQAFKFRFELVSKKIGQKNTFFAIGFQSDNESQKSFWKKVLNPTLFSYCFLRQTKNGVLLQLFKANSKLVLFNSECII